MPRLEDIRAESHEYYKFPTIKWFSQAVNQPGLAKGGVYLLGGPPGCGKSTLALTMMVDLASCGYKILYITLEQSPGWLKDTIENRVFPHRKAKESNIQVDKSKDWQQQLKKVGKQLEKLEQKTEMETIIEKNLYIDSSVPSMEALPDFFVRQVSNEGAQYKGTHIIVVDSLQGLGTAPTSSRPYAELYKFNRWTKDNGITCILIGHVTKAGQIAGPRSLEHNVDCIMYIRSALRLRPFFVPKNRFGPARYEPFALITDQWGCLEKSKHMEAISTRAYGYLGNRLVEVQALVKLPKYGAQPGILAPYLPKSKLKQIIGIVSRIKEIDISDLIFEINWNIPTDMYYSSTLDFPLAVSMLSSYFLNSLPPRSLFVGELDLMQQIRPLLGDHIPELVSFLSNEEISRNIEIVFISDQQSNQLATMLSESGSTIKVIGVSNLEDFINKIWPDIVV